MLSFRRQHFLGEIQMQEIQSVYKTLMQENDCVNEWLFNRPLNTKINYARHLSNFCKFANINPQMFQEMSRKEARDIAWAYIRKFLDKPSTMMTIMAALKSFL
jgi:hypothetical protein